MTPPPPFDATEAQRLLDQLRANAARLERDLYGGWFPPRVAGFLWDAIGVCQKFVDNHEQERARGWDPLALLRQHVDYVIKRLKEARREGH
jgi:hypothetical protein